MDKQNGKNCCEPFFDLGLAAIVDSLSVRQTAAKPMLFKVLRNPEAVFFLVKLF